jgi:hypothetical protein
MIKTFKIASIEPAAKLIKAQKSVDLNIPRADEIIRELGKNLSDGIEQLLDAATQEHQSVAVLKHLLRTASFAKKFTDPNDFDANRYVNIVKTMIVLTKLRYSPNVSAYCWSLMLLYSVREQLHISNLRNIRPRMF